MPDRFNSQMNRRTPQGATPHRSNRVATVEPISRKPAWVRQEDYDLANQQLRMGGEEADNMRRFLAAVAMNNPSQPDQEAITRRLQMAEAPVTEAPNFSLASTMPNSLTTNAMNMQEEPIAAESAGNELLRRLSLISSLGSVLGPWKVPGVTTPGIPGASRY